MQLMVRLVVLMLVACAPASAEVTQVTITTRETVANGQTFGATGAYEKLVGRIEFALDPSHSRNRRIADLDLAPRGVDGRIHFSADLYVLQPVDPSRGNGALLFEIANRGRKGLLTRFNRARGSVDPTEPAEFGDGFLMKEGYTLVWVGWQFDVAPPLLTIDAPPANLNAGPGVVRITFMVDAPTPDAGPADLPRYRPTDVADATATLSARDRFWEPATPIDRDRWSFVATEGRPRVRLAGGFEPGRVYELTYPSTEARVAGVGLAAIRDAASAFVQRSDLPVRGRTACVFGVSQSGRFLRQFLVDGFNVDERERRVFDAVWPHIAGAGLGSFNERLAMPGYSSFPATRFPFTDAEQTGPDGVRGGILASYRPEHQPKVIYTNTSVEYWGQGRAAALTHTSLDGTTDIPLPGNVRQYLLAGTQHTEAAFPPPAGPGQQLANPVPQGEIMRALLRAMHQWVSADAAPPESRYPRLRDGTLTSVEAFDFPAIPGSPNPRGIEGPGRLVNGRFVPLPFLVPQVDGDGNEVGGIRVPDVAVPLATTTGWNFRADRVGNPSTLYALLGSYIPLPRTRADRQARNDPRASIEERYGNRTGYLDRVRSVATELVNARYLLAEDLEAVMARASAHWEYATGTARAD